MKVNLSYVDSSRPPVVDARMIAIPRIGEKVITHRDRGKPTLMGVVIDIRHYPAPGAECNVILEEVA